MTPSRRRLRERLASDALIVVPEALDAAGARLVEMAGFEAVYCGGHALGGAAFAEPDHGLITSTEMIELAARIAAAVDIPLLVDGDQGGETALNVRRMVRSLDRAGVAGVHIEDTRNPKHMSIASASSLADMLQPVEEMQARIAAAVDGRLDDDFLIIARTDAMFNGAGVDAVIARGVAYAAAGADAYFVCLLPDEHVAAVARAVPIPIIDINHPVERARNSGLKMDIFAGHALPAMLWAEQACLDELRTAGFIERRWRSIPAEVFADLVRDRDYQPLFERWRAGARRD